jgi:hypothetical protein
MNQRIFDGDRIIELLRSVGGVGWIVGGLENCDETGCKMEGKELPLDL